MVSGYLAAALVLLAVLLAGRQVPGWASAVPAAGAVIALAWRLQATRGTGRSIWVLATLGVGLWSMGMLLERSTLGLAGAAMVGQVATVVALVRAARLRGPERDPVGLIDGATVATGVTFPLLAWWGGPPLAASTFTDPVLLLTLLAAPANLLMLAVTLRYLAGRGDWTPSGVAMPIAVGLAVAADLSSIQSSVPNVVQGLWAAACTACLVGALHPSARTLFAPGRRTAAQRQRVRVMMLALTAILPMAVLTIGYVNATPVDFLSMLLPLAVMTALIVLRATMMVRAARSGWQGAALLSAAVVVVALSGFAVIHSTVAGQSQNAAAERLDQLAIELQRVDWAVGNGLVAPSGSAATPAVVAAQMATLSRIRALRIPQQGEVEALHASYIRASQGALQRFDGPPTGREVQQALGSILPARAELLGRVTELADRYHAAAARSARSGRMATAGVLVAALCVLALLAIRLGRFTRRMESAEARSRADRASEARLRALLGASGDAIVVIDADLRILAFGEQLAPLCGLTAGAELSTLAAVLPADERARMRDCVSALSARPGHSDRLTWLVPGPEGVRHVEVFVVDHSSDARIGGIVLSARDITDRVELEAALEHQASHDPLTGLPNRSYLAERLAQRLAHEQADPAAAREQAIVLLDLDDFRAINDSVGHRVGDALLVELAQRLENTTVPGDLLARVGGDGFAFLVDAAVGETEAVARQRADLMLSALEHPMRDGSGAEHLLRGSVGIAVATTSELGSVQDHASLTFRDAELAMYEAKAVEGNSVEFYAPHMHGAVAQRLQLRSEMLLGLERGEFLLHYQPIVDLRRRSIVGYEALVRWQHPERGMVSPAEFIPAAEQSGLIVELGDWVLREACRQLVAGSPSGANPATWP